MDSLDRFFETYERWMPRSFGDMLAAVVLVFFVWMVV